MADYTTLANIKARIPITSTNAADDTFISTLITRASAMIDAYTDNHFTVSSAQTHKFDIPRRNPRRLLLDDWLLVCTSVTNGNGVVIPSTEYILEDYNNPPYYAIVLKPVSSYFFMPDSGFNDRKCISVVGDWGYSTTALADIAEACERLVVQAYRSRTGENMSGSSIITPAGVLQTPRAMTRDVTDILDGYKKAVLSVGGW
jgi:hypothetical protein